LTLGAFGLTVGHAHDIRERDLAEEALAPAACPLGAFSLSITAIALVTGQDVPTSVLLGLLGGTFLNLAWLWVA
jgi:hypothetical protein